MISEFKVVDRFANISELLVTVIFAAIVLVGESPKGIFCTNFRKTEIYYYLPLDSYWIYSWLFHWTIITMRWAPYCKASGIFAEATLNTFNGIQRSRIVEFMARIGTCSNGIIIIKELANKGMCQFHV